MPGGVGRPLVEHPELRALTRGAEAHEGLAATILGLAGWPVAAEEAAVARALAAPRRGRPPRAARCARRACT